MIYLDTSVALAHLLAEDRSPPERLWRESLIASRLLEYEVWNRIHAHGLGSGYISTDFVTLVWERVCECGRQGPYLEPEIRRVDNVEDDKISCAATPGAHDETIEFLRAQGQLVQLASYDDRQIAAARALRIGLYRL